MIKTTITAGAFDKMGARDILFLHRASGVGQLHVILYEDELVQSITGTPPEFPLPERKYFVENIRYVDRVHTIKNLEALENIRELTGSRADVCGVFRSDDTARCRDYAGRQGIDCREISADMPDRFPEHDYEKIEPGRKKVVVTGCFDWLHTGHIRFFEEASEYGDLYVVLGHDDNIRKLKGPNHPKFSQQQRKYVAGSIRFVTRALVSSGDGWLDAAPEIERIKPDIYLVNEDGHKGEKRRYCKQHGIEYVVLKREPKPGLRRRSSTELRGF